MGTNIATKSINKIYKFKNFVWLFLYLTTTVLIRLQIK